MFWKLNVPNSYVLSIYRTFCLFHSCLTSFHLLYVLSVQFLSLYSDYQIFCMFHFCVPMFSSTALQPNLGLGHFNHPPPGKFRGCGRSFVTNTFYWVGLLAPRPTPNLEDQDILFFFWNISFDLSGMGGPTSSHVTASIALRIIWPSHIVPFYQSVLTTSCLKF
jgi:hypothetical protein